MEERRAATSDPPPQSGGRARFSWSGGAALLLVVGCGLRLIDYSHNRSLWLDEIALALNVLARDFGGLLAPLDTNQGAPIFFLWSTKLVVELWGGHELAFRLLPVLFSIAGLVVFYRLARHSLENVAAFAATAFLCLSMRNIFYATQGKQFSADVFFCALLLLLALDLQAQSWPTRGAVLLALAGAAALWFSHPSVFVLAGACGVQLVASALRRDRRGLVTLGALSFAFLVSFAALYRTSLVHLNRDEGLADYWQHTFWPLPPTSWEELFWLPTTLFSQLPFFLGEARWLALAIVVTGLLSLLRRDRFLTACLLAPLVLTLAASALGKYPFGERLILFLSPVVFLFAGEGLGLTCAALARHGRAFAWVFALVVFAPLAQASFLYVAHPVEQQQFRQVIDTMSRSYLPGDGCYVLGHAWSGMRYYGPRFGIDPAACVYESIQPDNERQVLEAAATFEGHSRVWFVISYTSRQYRGRTSPFKALYENLGPRIRFEAKGNGVSAVLLDLRRAAGPPDPG